MLLLTAPTAVPPSALVPTTLHAIWQGIRQGVWHVFASYPWQTVGLIIIVVALVGLRVAQKVA